MHTAVWRALRALSVMVGFLLATASLATTHISGILLLSVDQPASSPHLLIEPAAEPTLTLHDCSSGSQTLTAAPTSNGTLAFDLPTSGLICSMTLDWEGSVDVRLPGGSLVATVSPTASTRTLPEAYDLEDANDQTFTLLIGDEDDWEAAAAAAAQGPLSSTQIALLTAELREHRVVTGSPGWQVPAP